MGALASGAKIADRYVLRHPLGEGGMGIVWRATDTLGGDDVALKFVKEAAYDARDDRRPISAEGDATVTAAPDSAQGQRSAQLRRRLFREAKAACAVAHPNVVRVDDILEHADSPVMVMEFLEGESLAECLDREGELSLEVLAPLMQQVVSAVGAAHSLGVVHRDLKPENIFLVERDDGSTEVKVLDFGIAKLVPSHFEATQSTELTKTGALVGTPCYMAPEQVYGERDIDGRADIWAIGLMMYRALSGILPTHAENIGQVMKIITRGGIWPLGQATPDLPAAMTRVVDHMLVRDREQRPQSLHPVRDALAEHTDVDTPDFGEPINSPPSLDAESEDSIEPARQHKLRMMSGVDPMGDTAYGASHSLVAPPMASRLPLWLALAGVAVVAVGMLLLRGDDAETSRRAPVERAASPSARVEAPVMAAQEREPQHPTSEASERSGPTAQPAVSASPSPHAPAPARRRPLPRPAVVAVTASVAAPLTPPPAPPKPQGLGEKIADAPADL